MGAPSRTKSFDCVEMKNRIQAKVRADYEEHKHEFPSFLAFVRARNSQSGWVERMEQKFGRPRPAPRPDRSAE